eukprot:CAMPEP_0117054390 /NCGR_PEP_ID=MMETSP0472-20121206/37697_1 /TAXON_ID=693140 ORGANISM="Tiarina fusus, Strain LIS" /NCGR_SAMPLE_ID=MMETSP0472 /ASSEMBLY_ACC=CAM_ASM_000603 /LENGTH=82 /DNA_ID=CAMNT_0004769965 /DNA_START=52 /DNA_END=297 /DNA_ORIENTATION=+
MEFEQLCSANLFDCNVASGLEEFEHSLSTEGNDDDPFAPIKDLDGLFDDKQHGSLFVQPRPLQEMMGSGLGGIDSLTKTLFK